MTYRANCKVLHASLQHPHKFKLSTEHNLSSPKSAIVDGVISYGGSTGIGLNLVRKAYGEFFERNHLFTGVTMSGKQVLKSIKPRSYCEKLLSLCRHQLEAEDHAFYVTDVYNLFDDSVRPYFYNSISLNGAKQDASFLHYSDSCACAAHPVKEAALYNALMEFIERQALLGSWLSQQYCYAIDPALLLQITPYADLVENLLDNGKLLLFANGNLLPGHTTILFYFANSSKDMVQYSIGSSAGLSLKESMTGSLEELHQCYSFLYNLESSTGLENKAGSGYHLSFQQCNHAKVKDTIPFINSENSRLIETLDDLNAVKKYSYEQILISLKDLSEDIYYYHHFEQALGLHFIKILSPDFFAHMALNETLNMDNLYAQRLGITRKNAYWVKIPFP